MKQELEMRGYVAAVAADGRMQEYRRRVREIDQDDGNENSIENNEDVGYQPAIPIPRNLPAINPFGGEISGMPRPISKNLL